jgi:hypothetical protein
MFKPSSTGSGSNLVLEILMIVVGINVALWFEGVFEDLGDRETEKRYLVDLRADLATDLGQLDRMVVWAEEKSAAAKSIVERLPEAHALPADELAQVVSFPSSYRFFTPSDFTYRSMQESGDFRLLENDAIKKGILRLDRRHNDIANLQKNYLQALDDGYIPLMMDSFDLTSHQLTDPDLLDNQLFKNFFAYVGNDTAAMAHLFRAARTESEDLIGLIDEYLGN